MTASYADIIFFAVVAIYLGIKLFAVLGKKNEQDANIESRRAPYRIPEVMNDSRQGLISPNVRQVEIVVKNNLENFKFASDEVKNGIKEIIEKDPNFSLETFVEGAKIALEMVFKAFSEGDKKTLKSLLSDDLYNVFEKQIDDTNARGLVTIKSLVGIIDDIDIVSASMAGSRAKIGLKLMTEQINATKDVNGNIIEGDTKKIEVVEDIWEFERNTRSGNPNWSVISL